MSEREQRYQQRDNKESTMVDKENSAEAFFKFKRTEEFHNNMAESIREMDQLPRGLNQKQNMHDKGEGSNSNAKKTIAEGEKTSINTKLFKAKFLSKEDMGKGQPDQANEMYQLHAECNALSAAVRYAMTFTEYYRFKTKGGNTRKGYDEKKDI